MADRLKNAPHYQALQTMRLAEVRAITPEQWRALRTQMAQAAKLPKLAEHFRKHGEQFAGWGIASPQEFEQLFLEHIRRSDLQTYTYVTTQKGQQYRYWILAAMDNGVVALIMRADGDTGRFGVQMILRGTCKAAGAGGCGWKSRQAS